MTQHRVFYSFHYKPDVWRTSSVRSIGAIEGNIPVLDNDWETVKKGGDTAIKKWIADQMKGRSCTIVLVGTNTAERKWINYEINKSWDDGMGVVGIYIHGLKRSDSTTSTKGRNPFTSIAKLPSTVRCYDPDGSESKERFAWIREHLVTIVAEAKEIRKNS